MKSSTILTSGNRRLQTRSAILLSLAMMVPLNAATLIVDFTNDDPINRPAAYDGQPNVFQNQNTTNWTQTTTDAGTSHAFTYDISSLNLGAATKMTVTVSTVNGTSTLRPAAGNGIAVNGGLNTNWFDSSDTGLNFAVSLQNSSNANVTSSYAIDLTGAAIR